jgi:two-component system chemotaxis sensor kinase CheA
MNLDEALQTFIAESRELLQEMEGALLRVEQSPEDADLVNAIFRAAHTIKGSAGLFGLDDIVAFTHVAESVLDRVRSQELCIEARLVALLLETCDHIATMVDRIAGSPHSSEDLHARSQALIANLRTFLKDEAQAATPGAVMVESNTSYTKEGGGAVETDRWHISLRFGEDVLRNGMDPLSFIRYLETLGEIVHIVTLTDYIPPLAEMDPERCYLGFEIGFKSDADKATIESVFDFVREDSQIRILPPHSMINEYIQHIQDMPEEDMRVGEMLVRCGTLTSPELAAALAIQQGEDQDASRPIGQVLVEEHMVQPEVMDAALEKQKLVKEARGGGDAHLIRVDANKLDQLINLVGELIIAGASVNLIAQRAGVAELLETTATMSRLVEEVRDSALNLRMVQIGATFSRFQRVVRDVSKELDKDIRLVINGEDTELDKTVVEKIGDPLTHLVRNAMDHGIEPAEVRLSRGKSTHGTLRLNAYHDAGSIVIEVSDDGGGLNKEKILRKAIERGLVNEGQSLSDKEIYNLIFEPGFSTADQISNLSGRGVGMDVVRRNIQALRGAVDLESTPGLGSTVRIRLPLTLAIIDGFLVEVGKAAYVVPLDMVVECIELGSWDSGGDGSYLNLRGEVMPYLRLREHFEVGEQVAKRESVVVVHYGQNKVGLVVDRLMGEFQTVIKPLGKVFSQTRGIGGFTILGSGEVALILDVPGLIGQAAGNTESRMSSTGMVQA